MLSQLLLNRNNKTQVTITKHICLIIGYSALQVFIMLYIIATPIGNLEDISFRAVRILKEVDLVLCEDTRKTGLLLKYLGIKKKMTSFYEHNEERKKSWVLEELKNGRAIALLSNAGTPTISDPGYRLIRECRKQKIEITSLPGPSSIINAVSLASIPHDKFSFLGYLPRKRSARRKVLERIKKREGALIFFESPFRIVSSLKDAKDILGNRKVCVGREMTKKFEEVLEMNLEEAIGHFAQKKPKGEFTIVLEGSEA